MWTKVIMVIAVATMVAGVFTVEKATTTDLINGTTTQYEKSVFTGFEWEEVEAD